MRVPVQAQGPNALRRFLQEQQGTLAVFSLFIFLSMIFMAGLAIDLMRHENERIRMQNTADRAVLAATLVDLEAENGPTPEQIIQAYFTAEGLSPQLGSNYRVEPLGETGRRITVYPAAQVNTLFSRLVGIDTLDMVTPARAEHVAGSEGSGNLEVVMVLDVSGSMNGQGKIGAMRTAANSLITSVLDAPGTDAAAITLVPYHNNVLPPAGFLNNYTNIWGNGPCITWSNWSNLRHTPQQQVSRRSCSTHTWRTVRPYLDDPAEATAYINQLQASGGTASDLGVRWAATFFDPDTRDNISAMIAGGDIDPAFEGRPYEWESDEVVRVMILLTDGENNSNQSDTNTLDVCTSLKDENVTIYTVAFQAPTRGINLMQSCASSPSHFYDADVNEILEAFQGITASIQTQMLRLTL